MVSVNVGIQSVFSLHELAAKAAIVSFTAYMKGLHMVSGRSAVEAKLAALIAGVPRPCLGDQRL